MDAEAAALRNGAGTGTVVGNLAEALTDLLGLVAVAIVALVTFRDELRRRLRRTRPAGVPVLTDAVDTVASHLAVERGLGRVAAEAEIDVLAPTLIGSAHLLFADRQSAPPEPEAVRKSVAAVIGGVVREPEA